ncbi:MAG: ActS/PrrB/RegB family redox-sensitive histidine kinase [Roseiarcus sp.]|uniref:ActS/PrrB/RegB family redox-sensitive histidine kinase n=1 Tax=Roseiarcus sp. TaxID=1969460 RepID=UPI003C3CDC89
MFAPEGERFDRQARRLRLNTLIGLRWLAVAGQTAAILIAAFGLGLRFPVLACLTLVAASAALNLALRWRLPVSLQLSERAATGLLAYDILQLAGLLFLTGGVANPFVILFLAPVTIAATSLSLRNALALLGLALVCVTALLRASLPLPWIGGESLVLPPLYVLARWVALAVSAAFVTLYAYRVAQEARHTASALTATELVLARAQHLSQIDGLAAAAAHELGTPLATIALVVREMAAHPPQGEEFIDDLRLLEQSVEQCRSILGKLSSPSELSGQPMDLTSPVELAEIAAAPHRLLGVTIAVEGEGSGPAPKCPRNPGVLYGLGNLIENAVSFAEKAVVIRTTWSPSTVRIVIADDGRGFPPHMLARAGEPYLSQRDGAPRSEETGGGLGLGLFIARSLLERSGATLQFANAAAPASGAVASVQWPRSTYEQSRRTGD